jgi:hypothetical protein
MVSSPRRGPAGGDEGTERVGFCLIEQCFDMGLGAFQVSRPEKDGGRPAEDDHQSCRTVHTRNILDDLVGPA